MKAVLLLCAALVSGYSQPINVVAKGVDNTGATDIGPAIRQILSSLGGKPAVLYFPQGTYYCGSSEPNTNNEECVKVKASVHFMGDGVGKTIFRSDQHSTAMSILAFFNPAAHIYTYEDDPGFAAAPAGVGTITVALATHSDAGHFPAGQPVYLRGKKIGQSSQFHGEWNKVAVAGDVNTGQVQLLYPLASDYSQEGALQLNVVGVNETVHDLEISGITFDFYQQAILGAQVFGWRIHDNQFNYIGPCVGQQCGMFQFNQVRRAEFDHNSIMTNHCSNNALDPSRNPTEWSIHDNYICGSSGAGEAGAKVTYAHNTFNCTGVDNCVAFGGVYGGLIDSNLIYATTKTGPDVSPAVVYDSLSTTSPATLITGNIIVSGTSQAPAIRLATPGSASVGNLITAAGTAINFQAGEVSSKGDQILLTSGASYGCWLIEGASHFDLIADAICTAAPGVTGWGGVYIGDNGPQSGQVTVTGVHFSNLHQGIAMVNAAHDQPVTAAVAFHNVATPGPQKQKSKK
jgi:hypothetical protein